MPIIQPQKGRVTNDVSDPRLHNLSKIQDISNCPGSFVKCKKGPQFVDCLVYGKEEGMTDGKLCAYYLILS